MSDRSQAKAEVPWLLDSSQKSKLVGSGKPSVDRKSCYHTTVSKTLVVMQARPARRQQRQQSAKPPQASTDDTHQPKTKRRKHGGYRAGTPPHQEQTQHTGQEIYHMPVAQSKGAVNHNLIERGKAEAQLAGRRYQLDNSGCIVPSQQQLFRSQAWTLPEMMTQKGKLNAEKDMLDCKDIK